MKPTGVTFDHPPINTVTATTVAELRDLGVPESNMSDVEMGALLRDIGKIGVPDAKRNRAAATKAPLPKPVGKGRGSLLLR